MTKSTGADLLVALLRTSDLLIEELHARLAAQGHPDARPLHAFTFQAIRRGARTSTALAAELGVTKQAAGQLVAELERRGYLTRTRAGDDARARPIALTPRATDLLARSARILGQLRREWSAELAAGELDRLGESLAGLERALGRPGGLRPLA